MTFRELMINETVPPLSPSFRREEKQQEGLWHSLVTNQSPVIKLWFAAMVLNFILLLCLVN